MRWAVGYRHAPELAFAITPETCLGLMCVLAVLLVPLVRQEFNIVALTAAPPTKAEIDEICSEVAKEFSLSGREPRSSCSSRAATPRTTWPRSW